MLGATYDANNFAVNDMSKEWDLTASYVISGDSLNRHFHTLVGIADIASPDQSLSIYPNPCSGKFTISSTNPISSIEIYNLAGNCIYSSYNPGRQCSVTLNLSNSPKGVYIVKALIGGKVQGRKIILQ